MISIFVSCGSVDLRDTSARFAVVKLQIRYVVQHAACSTLTSTYRFVNGQEAGLADSVPFLRLAYLMQYLLTSAMKSNCSASSRLILRRCRFVVAWALSFVPCLVDSLAYEIPLVQIISY